MESDGFQQLTHEKLKGVRLLKAGKLIFEAKDRTVHSEWVLKGSSVSVGYQIACKRFNIRDSREFW
jgi:hypothetical protein